MNPFLAYARREMRRVARPSWLLSALAVAAVVGQAPLARAQDLPRVSVSRKLRIGGLGVDPHVEDLLGLGRTKFQGLLAGELSSVGYQLADDGAGTSRAATGA